MAILEVHHIEKHFGATRVLEDISFDLEQGQALAIIGSSGSGKTTLLRCLNFLEKPEQGTISVAGNLIFDAADPATQRESEVRKKRLHFGLVFQDFNLFPQYTALENVTLARRLLAKSERTGEAPEAIRREGEALLRALIDRAAGDAREEIGAGELIVGLKCGGSDGLSGVTANPLVGRVADRLVAMGGTALLAEIPEMFGAEGVLFRRCADEAAARALPELVGDFKDYFVRHGQVVYENPSPGNKAGGITTLEEKSLGCVQKGGSAPVSISLRSSAWICS